MHSFYVRIFLMKIKTVLRQISNFGFGFIILLFFYYISRLIVQFLHIQLPPAILGLILFTTALTKGIIKEEQIKSSCEVLINNMAMFLVPLFCGLMTHGAIITKNWIAIFVVIFVTTTAVIVFTGLFTEWGIKFLRLSKIRKFERKEK